MNVLERIINAVVSKLNWKDKMDDFIIEANPERWKIFQVLPILGQNDKYIEELAISQTFFDSYIQDHKHIEEVGVNIVFENNDDMLGSYLMIDPAGRFYDNVNEAYFYSSPILEVGINTAYSQIKVDYQKFIKRQGLYDWSSREYGL